MNKICTDCNIEKSNDEFTKNKTGYRNKCKLCYNKYQREYTKNKKTNEDAKLKKYLSYKLLNIKRQDEKKFPDREFLLTVDDLMEIFMRYEGKCVYSNKKLIPGVNVSVYKKISFDRIDNDLPHTKDNLQLTSVFMNVFRGDKTHKEFSELFSQA